MRLQVGCIHTATSSVYNENMPRVQRHRARILGAGVFTFPEWMFWQWGEFLQLAVQFSLEKTLITEIRNTINALEMIFRLCQAGASVADCEIPDVCLLGLKVTWHVSVVYQLMCFKCHQRLVVLSSVSSTNWFGFMTKVIHSTSESGIISEDIFSTSSSGNNQLNITAGEKMCTIELPRGNVFVNAVFYDLANWSLCTFLNLIGSRVWWSIRRWYTRFPRGGKARQRKRERE